MRVCCSSRFDAAFGVALEVVVFRAVMLARLRPFPPRNRQRRNPAERLAMRRHEKRPAWKLAFSNNVELERGATP
jgi:hypothetical protein